MSEPIAFEPFEVDLSEINEEDELYPNGEHLVEIKWAGSYRAGEGANGPWRNFNISVLPLEPEPGEEVFFSTIWIPTTNRGQQAKEWKRFCLCMGFPADEHVSVTPDWFNMDADVDQHPVVGKQAWVQVGTKFDEYAGRDVNVIKRWLRPA